jgi:pimeloyl-ACP methyl ester carboxylesterase
VRFRRRAERKCVSTTTSDPQTVKFRAPGDGADITLVADGWNRDAPSAAEHPVILIGASMGGMTGMLVADAAGRQNVTKLVLVDVVPRYEKEGSARIREFMSSGIDGFESLDEAADAVAAYLPYRKKPRSPEGLKKNLRLRDGRWYWHWDPAFLTAPMDDPFVRVERLERAVIESTIPILLIRGKLSDVVSADGVRDFLEKVSRAEFVELPEAGHTAAGDDNDAFSEVVVQFVCR